MNPTTFSLPPGVGARLGIPIERLCAQAGVSVSQDWGTSDFFRLWAAVDDHLNDPAAGLRFGADGIARGYGVAAIVALHAPDLRHALASLGRYKRLTCPELVDVEYAGDEAVVRYRWLQATGTVPRLLVDTTMASLASLAWHGTGGRVAPKRLELARRRENEALLVNHFGCPVLFEAAQDAMVFEQAALDVRFSTADGAAFSRVLAGLDRDLLVGAGFAPLAGQVRVAIARQLSDGVSPSVAAVARRLGVGSRTLQRRLDEDGTSFGQQLATVRRTIAVRLLAVTDLDTVAIAMLLGFTEPNSFARAFRGWEQTTPARWRERQAGATA